MLRIQVLQDLPKNRLLFSLLNMREDGSSLSIRVDNYAALKELIRNSYAGDMRT